MVAGILTAIGWELCTGPYDTADSADPAANITAIAKTIPIAKYNFLLPIILFIFLHPTLIYFLKIIMLQSIKLYLRKPIIIQDFGEPRKKSIQ